MFFLLLIMGIWFKFDGYTRLKTKDDMEDKIHIIKDDDVLVIWHNLSLLNEKIIFTYTKILPIFYWTFSFIFLIFYFKKWNFPDISFLDYPLLTFLVSFALFVLTCFTGNLPILIEKDLYFNRKQSGQLCALYVNSHKHNLIVLYSAIKESRFSIDAIENFPEDIYFLNRVIFIAKNLEKIAFLWHSTLIALIIFVIFLISKFNL